jgi:hypothetical protein
MAIVNGSLELGYKNLAWFNANPTLVLKEGQIVYLQQTGTYKIGNGTSTLSALSFLGVSSETQTLQNVTDLGATTTNSITANGFVKSGGTASQFLKANGSVDSTTYLSTQVVPVGGTTGQILAKVDDTDYNLEWIENYANYTSVLKHTVKAGQAINKGQAVYVSSADGTNMIVSKASNVSEALSSKVMGLLETTLANNAQGFVITEGLLAGLNTNSATIGDPVWLGVDGALIYGLLNKPYAPANLVFIGIVTRVNTNNGEIFVKPQNGFELKELHDVDLITNTLKNNDVLVYDSASGLWENKQSNYLQIVSKDITDSTALTGTTAITLMKSVLIPANTFTTGDTIKILNRAVRNTATGGAIDYMYINTTNTLTGATLVGTMSGSLSFYGMERSLYIKSATNSETYNTSLSSAGSEVTTGTSGASSLNINWAVNQYVIAAFQNAAVGNSTVMSSLIIQKF